jgi:PAS domain S-box-containing protein
LNDSAWIGYAVAVFGTAAAAGLRWVLYSITGPDLPPFITFYPVVILSALLGGAGAGLVATILSFGVVDYFFAASFHNFRIPSPVDVVELSIFFILVNLLTSLAGGTLRRVYRRTSQQSRELARTVDLLNAELIERKAAQEMSRQSEKRFRTVAEVSSQVVWVSTPQGEPATDSASWREFTGRTQEQWTGWNWLEAVHPDERARVAAHWRTALENLQPYRDEYRLLHASGLFRHVQARAVPVRDAAGKVTEWIGTLTDITTAKRAEAARNMLTGILAESDDAIITKNLEGMITSWNRGAERLFGYSAEQMLGQNFKLLIPPDRLVDEICVLEELRRGERVDHYESKRLTRAGRLIDVSITASPIHDAANEVVGVSTIARDITERKRIEDQNRVQLAALQAAGSGVVIAGTDGTIQWINRAFTELTGYSEAEAIGKNPRLLKSGKHDRAFYAKMWQTLTGGRVWQGELINRRKDGSLYTEEMTIAPVFDAAGAIEHFVAVKQDVTARNLADEAQRRLAAIVASTEDAIVSTGLDGTILTWNAGAEHLLGYASEQVIGQSVMKMIPPERVDEEYRMWERLNLGDLIEHYETVHLAKDGRKLDVSVTVSPLKDSQGRITGASKIVRNIGEIVRARAVLLRSKEELEELVQERTAALREAMGELERMSYSMVHDMRAPLRAMQSFAMLLEEEGADSMQPAGLDYIRRIREAANRLDRLITDALNYNEVVRHHSEPTDVELGKLLRGMLETYPNLHPDAADIDVEFKELLVLGNESLLTQCFGNLLGNATKFVAPAVKPRVRVWAEEKHGRVETPGKRHGHWVRIWVEDNGIGIPKEAQEKIFGMFQRLHRANEYPGTGIGLAIVRKAVERMGGQVALESEPGKGSRFWVELPKADRGEPVADAER